MRQKSARTLLIIMTVLAGVGGVLGIALAFSSLFLFDAPGSEKNPATIALFISALTFPLVCLLSIALSWLLYWRKRFRLACYLAFIPAINVLSGTAALAWLQVFNGGRFS